MAMQYWMTDGNKSIALSQYPPESWTILSGKSEQEQDTSEAVSKARAQVGILYRCLDIRRNAITRIPWEISRGDTVLWSSEDTECPPELEWMELLPTQYLADIELMLCLCNQAYMLKERNRAKMLGLKWLAKSTMTPLWDETNGLVGFERRISAENKKRFEPDDILYIWRRNPEHETKPDVSPAQAALSAANVVYGMDEFVKGYFNRGGVKLTLFGVPESTSTTERDRFNSVLKRMFRGVRSAWSTFVFNADQINPVTIGEGIGELHNDQLMNNRQNALVTTMGVPHSKLFSNAANYATAQQDDMAFYADTLIPDAVMIARQVNRQLLRPLGLAWTFHPEQMSVFQEDEEQRSVALLNYVQAGYPLSVASEMLGLTLPRGMEYSELDATEPEPGEPEPAIVQPVPTQPALPPPADNTAEAKAAEIRRFKAWAGKRKHPDPDKFSSDTLNRADKTAILRELYPLEELHWHGEPMKQFQIGDPDIDPALLEYERELQALTEEAVTGQIDKPEFEQRMREIVFAALLLAFLRGHGGNEDELASSAQAAFRAQRNRANESIADLSNDIYNLDRYAERDGRRPQTEAQGLERAFGRVILWVSALAGVYALGLLHKPREAGQPIIYYQWQLGRTSQHCSDCLRLNGQVHTQEEWLASGWQPQGRNLECGGWNCDCRLVRVDGPSRGSF